MAVKFKPCLGDKLTSKIMGKLQKSMNMRFKGGFLNLYCGKCGERIERNLNELLPASIPKVTEYNIFVQLEHNLFHCKQEK